MEAGNREKINVRRGVPVVFTEETHIMASQLNYHSCCPLAAVFAKCPLLWMSLIHPGNNHSRRGSPASYKEGQESKQKEKRLQTTVAHLPVELMDFLGRREL